MSRVYRTKPDEAHRYVEIEPCREFLGLRVVSRLDLLVTTLHYTEVKKLRKELKKWLKTGKVGEDE